MAVTRILLIYCQRANVNNATTENTSKQTKHQTKSQFVYKLVGRVTKGAGIEVFLLIQRTRALSREQSRFVKDRSRKSGSARERSLTILAQGRQIYVLPRAVLEVGRYGSVWHTGTSLAGLKPYRRFFLTTAIQRNSFVATKCIFWAQNIAHMHLLCHRPHWGSLQLSLMFFWDTVRES